MHHFFMLSLNLPCLGARQSISATATLSPNRLPARLDRDLRSKLASITGQSRVTLQRFAGVL